MPERHVGMLRDVEAGFDVDMPQILRARVADIVLREREIEPSGGCWGMIRKMFIWLKPRNWQAELSQLSEGFADLALKLEQSPEGNEEREIVAHHSYELAGRLRGLRGGASPHLLLDRARDLADRIRQMAGRKARKRANRR